MANDLFPPETESTHTHTHTIAPNPASELIVDSADNTTVDTLDNEGQVMVDEGAI